MDQSLTERDEQSLFQLLLIILRQRNKILFITGSVVLLTLILAVVSLVLPPEKSFLPNVYTPKAVMLLNNSDGSGLSGALSSSGLGDLASLAGISGSGSNYGELALKILNMSSNLDKIIEKFNLIERYKITKNVKTNSRITVAEKLKADFDDKTGLFVVNYTDIDPILASEIVNYSVEIMEKRFATIGGNRNLSRKIQLEEKIADVRSEMTLIENKIKEFQQKYGVISIDTLATQQISTVAQIRSALMMKDMEIKTYRDLTKIEDPQIRKMEAERENLAILLEELEGGFSEYDSNLPSQKDIPEIALEYTHYKRDLMIQEAIFTLLIQQLELTKLLLSGEEPVFQVLELAEIPDRKSGPSRSILVIVISIFSFLSSLAIVILIEIISNIKRDNTKVEMLKNAWKKH